MKYFTLNELTASATANETEMENLKNLIQSIVQRNSNNYREYYYPMASYCYAYEPTIHIYETLAEKFKVHNWYLPNAAGIARFAFYWTRNDTTGVSKYDAFRKAKAVHEAEHIKQSILKSYRVDDSGEAPAYTIGYIVKKMWEVFSRMIAK